ncbi:MAG: universal stress protein [Brucellaceae bacterium]|nr:universal stress protein [Brucellaceae bacterium]
MRAPKIARQHDGGNAGATADVEHAPVLQHIEIAHDPAIDLDEALEKACKEIGADLVVMASHVPGFGDHFRSSNAGYLSAHSSISVFVVR